MFPITLFISLPYRVQSNHPSTIRFRLWFSRPAWLLHASFSCLDSVQNTKTAVPTLFSRELDACFTWFCRACFPSPLCSATGLGTSRNIPADATIEQVQAGLMEDFPTLGRMLVVREEYVFCACDDGYIWTITFDEVVHDILVHIVARKGCDPSLFPVPCYLFRCLALPSTRYSFENIHTTEYHRQTPNTCCMYTTTNSEQQWLMFPPPNILFLLCYFFLRKITPH